MCAKEFQRIKLSDERYSLIELKNGGYYYIYLNDHEQKSESLGRTKSFIDLNLVWEKHTKDKNYCLPCELFLYVEEKVFVARGFEPLENGLTLSDLKNFKKLQSII